MSDPPPEFTLTEDERHTALWLRLEAHLSTRLVRARNFLESDLDERQTVARRSEINCLKQIIRLGEGPPDMTDEPEAPRAFMME